MNGTELLVAAEDRDNYRLRCSQSDLNAAARAGQKYEPFFVSKAIADYMEDYAAATPILHDAQILVLHPSADGGFPHTRPRDLICMPASACSTTLECRETLLHEAMHLHQRKHLPAWFDFSVKEGWAPQPADAIPPEMIAATRINPDTIPAPFWSWQDYYVPLPLFVPKPKQTISDVQIRWLDIRNYTLNSTPISFTATYGSPSQPEHPFEIYAVNFAAEGLRTVEDVDRKLKA